MVEPAVNCGGGWWRIANRGKQLWHADTPPTVETANGAGWEPVAPAETLWVAGRIRLDRNARAVRLSGSFLPLTPLLTAAEWELENDLAAPMPTLGGRTGAAKLVAAYVTLARIDGSLDDSRGPFYLSLPTSTGFYHAVGGTAIPDGDVLRVTVDPHSLRHVDERARP